MAEKIVTEKTMTEKIVKGKKNGMAVLLFNILLVVGIVLKLYNNLISSFSLLTL